MASLRSAGLGILLSGCAAVGPPSVVPVGIAPPPWPVLPTVTAAEARKIDDVTWRHLVERDQLWRNAFRECRAVLEAHRP